MVAIMTMGEDFYGALEYNEKKVREKDAQLIYQSGFPKEIESMTFQNKLAVFRKLTALNTRTQNKVVHFSLNLHPQDVISGDKFTEIAKEYMELIGFGEQPYLIYNHTDSGHQHLHIVTTCIKKNGKRIPMRYFGANVSKPALQKINAKYNLTKGQPGPGNYDIEKVEIEVAEYGKKETKKQITEIVTKVLEQYPVTTIQEFDQILNKYNIFLDRGEHGSIMRQKNGIRYSIIGNRGQQKGNSIKASEIRSKPTYKNIEVIFSKNKNYIKEHNPEYLYNQRIVRNLFPTGTSVINAFEILKTMYENGIVLNYVDSFKIGARYRTTKNDSFCLLSRETTLALRNAKIPIVKLLSAQLEIEKLLNNTPDRSNKPIAPANAQNIRNGQPSTINDKISSIINDLLWIEQRTLDPYELTGKKKKKKRKRSM